MKTVQRLSRTVLCLAIAGLTLNPLARAAEVHTARPFLGVTHHQIVEAADGSTKGGPFDLPRPLVIHVVEIDPGAAGVRFLVQPGNGDEPGEVTRMTTRSFVDSVGAQIGINGDFYGINPQHPSSNGKHFADVINNGVSDGKHYSLSYRAGRPIFNVSSNNVARVLRAARANSWRTCERVPLYNAIGGNQRLVARGFNTTPRRAKYTKKLNPHSALGVTCDGAVLLVAVDGRQPGYSEGMKTTEIADFLIKHFDARDVLNIDGGGSTTLVLDDTDDGRANARVVNSPSDGSTPQKAGNERLVANSLAVFAEPNREYVLLEPAPRPEVP